MSFYHWLSDFHLKLANFLFN